MAPRNLLRHRDCNTAARRRSEEVAGDLVLLRVLRVLLLLLPQLGLPSPLLALDDLVEQFAELD